MLSVAIVGAGRVGNIRADVIRCSGGAVLAAVADVDPDRARNVARGTRAHIHSDWESAVALPEVDAVIVATPTKFHADVAIAALEAGKHVLCEKPLGRNVEEARRMCEASRKCGRLLKTGFNYRHMAHVRHAKELLEAGELGPVYFLRCRFGHGGRPGYEAEWCTNGELSGGGVLLEQGIHIFDLVRHFLGEPERLLARTGRFFWNFQDAEDNGFCLLETASGQVAQIHVSWTQWVNLFEIELFGRDGYLRLEGRGGHYGQQSLTWGTRQADHTRPAEKVFDFPNADDSWELEWREFLAAVRTAREPSGSAADGLRAQQLAEAAYQSAAARSWIDIPSLEEEMQGVKQ